MDSLRGIVQDNVIPPPEMSRGLGMDLKDFEVCFELINVQENAVNYKLCTYFLTDFFSCNLYTSTSSGITQFLKSSELPLHPC